MLVIKWILIGFPKKSQEIPKHYLNWERETVPNVAFVGYS